MDTGAATVGADLANVFGFFLNVEEEDHPTALKQRNTVIKFTRIPAHDLDNKVSWPQPRFRRIVTLEDQQIQTSRSLQMDVGQPAITHTPKMQRKIATIAEDDENDLHPKFSKDGRKSTTARSSRAIQVTEPMQARSLSNRSAAGLSNAKFSKEMKQSPKLNNALSKKKSDITNNKVVRNKNFKQSQKTEENNKISQTSKDRVQVRSSRSTTTQQSSVTRAPRAPPPAHSDQKIVVIKNKLQGTRSPSITYKPPTKTKENMKTNRPVDIIRVPIETRFKTQPKLNNTEKVKDLEIVSRLTDNSTETESRTYRDAEVITDLAPKKTDQESFTGDLEYDTLNVPNLSLKDSSEKLVSLLSQSMPNLDVPALKITHDRDLRKAASYIIGQATLTYTTKQKINIHVVNREPSPFSYPVSVVSVFKNEKRSEDKLVRNDVIGSIRINKELLPRDCLTEQFERELSFIDSFVESLQYLEGLEKLAAAQKEQCLSESGLPEYSDFLRRLESGAGGAVASKSLCLLNLLIRDEQRRAKNLLFVLKMREDALKDFTKSQILYLENKKKQDNIDISTLKKKQRGALLKLQHECGEMQRMRKALLMLSEKRKQALMKTKKNIELKLGNISVEKINSKKKLRKVADRSAPLKCFDLSSSCEEVKPDMVASSAQTEPSMAAAENFVVVDGGYLNILFENLRLPQIFSNGRQYEVNEEALKNILSSANSQLDFSDSDLIAKFVDQICGGGSDKSSSPSTARSLVEEFDQYYKVLNKEDSRQESESHESCGTAEFEIEEVTSGPLPVPVGASEDSQESLVWKSSSSASDTTSDTAAASTQITTPFQMNSSTSLGSPYLQDILPIQASFESTPSVQIVSSIITSEPQASDPSVETSVTSVVSLQTSTSVETLAPVAEPIPSVDCEAERLRRQQLAIEREIKALEQQQNQLLIVREIPDKPPPPYTPPGDNPAPQPPRKFLPDEETHCKIQKLLEGSPTEGSEPADLFLKDFCDEVMERRKAERSDKPWDAYNLLPRPPEPGPEQLAANTFRELTDILDEVHVVPVLGSDHIEDILLAEWRQREVEWTNLHADETAVKNQLFESIFDSLVAETVEEYKKLFKT